MSCCVCVELNLDLRLWGVVDHSTTPTRDATKTRARGIGGCVRREASIEGVRFRCRLQAVSRSYPFLTHRNLRHAGRRLKRAFRFRKVLWLLSSKESNNKNKPVLKHSVCVTACAVTPQCNLSRRTPVRRYSSTKVHEGHEGEMRLHNYCRLIPPACPFCVWG
jgi:hypothetical protein